MLRFAFCFAGSVIDNNLSLLLLNAGESVRTDFDQLLLTRRCVQNCRCALRADIFDAKTACEHLSGFNVGGRYLTVLYYQPQKAGRPDITKVQAEVDALKAKVQANEDAEKLAAEAGGDESLDEDEKDRRMAAR